MRGAPRCHSCAIPAAQFADARARAAVGLEEKEKLYLDCLDAYYNEGGKQLLSEDDYQKLKLDLEFSTSRVTLFSKDEIKFMIANKRYRMGKQIMSDDEYDALRKKLKGEGSVVALHDEVTPLSTLGVLLAIGGGLWYARARARMQEFSAASMAMAPAAGAAKVHEEDEEQPSEEQRSLLPSEGGGRVRRV